MLGNRPCHVYHGDLHDHWRATVSVAPCTLVNCFNPLNPQLIMTRQVLLRCCLQLQGSKVAMQQPHISPKYCVFNIFSSLLLLVRAQHSLQLDGDVVQLVLSAVLRLAAGLQLSASQHC
jgi:hypothetical protein